MKQYYLHITASKKNGTLYVGVTGDLLKRIAEHRQKLIEGFTKKYNVHILVYYECITTYRKRSHERSRLKIGEGVGKWVLLKRQILNAEIYITK